MISTTDARTIAAGYKERCDQMGERHAESGRLSECVAVICDLCDQIDAHAVMTISIASLNDPVLAARLDMHND